MIRLDRLTRSFAGKVVVNELDLELPAGCVAGILGANGAGKTTTLNMLMTLLEQFVIEERAEIMRQNIRFSTIGRRDGLTDSVLAEIQKTIVGSALARQ